MTHGQHEALTGGWRESVAGWVVSGYAWLFSDMPIGAAAVTTATFILTIIKIVQAVMVWRTSDRTKPVGERLNAAFGTKPAPLGKD